MLEVRALKKAYGKIVAVDGVSLRAGSAETIGLLGPNGAGKTTTVSMIAGLFPPDSGEVLDFLRASPVFAGLPAHELESLVAAAREAPCRAREYVFHEGDPALCRR